MVIELIRAFILTFVAEMGDKTQILAMTFATKYSIKDVLIGVIIGILLNHGLAIVVGRMFSKLIPINYIQLIIGIVFILFGYLSLIEEDEEDDEEKSYTSPIITVALTFFLGELGDKSQLTAMSLSAEANFPLLILMGTTLGMTFTSGIGIFIGSKIGDKIPDGAIKLVSSIIFVAFGSLKLVEEYSFNNIYIYLLVILAIELFLIYRFKIIRKTKPISPMKLAAQKLYEQTKEIKLAIDDLCLGPSVCGKCSEDKCLVGYIKYILNRARENENYQLDNYKDIDNLIKKELNQTKLIQSLALIISTSIENNWSNNKNFVINIIAGYLEEILFGGRIDKELNSIEYINLCKEKNLESALKLEYILKNS